MLRLVTVGFLVFGCTILDPPAYAADAPPTDVNVVTALDISQSMDAGDMTIAIQGMAHAIRAPEVLEAIRSGQHGRIGIAVFAWHHGVYPELVSWRLLATSAEATDISRQIEASLAIDVEALSQPHFDRIGRATDISQAIYHASELLRAAPYPTNRLVINIIGNGTDNIGEGPEGARDHVTASGGTINGVVLGGDPAVVEYYRRSVIGGSAAFLLFGNTGEPINEMLTRKFRYDIAMNMIRACPYAFRDRHATAGARARCGTNPAIIAAANARPNELDQSQE